MKNHIASILALFICLFAGTSIEAQNIQYINSEAIVEKAREAQQPYLVEMKTTWCGYCKLFEKKTLTDKGVIKYLSENYQIGLIDAENDKWGEKLASQYKVKAFPTILVFSYDGKLLGKLRGYQDAEQFSYNLAQFVAKHDKYKAKKK